MRSQQSTMPLSQKIVKPSSKSSKACSTKSRIQSKNRLSLPPYYNNLPVEAQPTYKLIRPCHSDLNTICITYRAISSIDSANTREKYTSFYEKPEDAESLKSDQQLISTKSSSLKSCHNFTSKRVTVPYRHVRL